VDKTGRRDSKESNFDSQISLSGCSFDGSSNPTTYKSATFGFDPEDRLTSISSPAFSAAYDGDGLRIKKTANGTTTYFLYDGGNLAVEETYNGSTAALANVNGWTADGLRARLESGIAYDFMYDPQGSLVERQSSGAYSVGYGAYDQAIYEGYGALRQDVKLSAGATGGTTVGARDPVGFGGQFGYYTDTETGLLCLTHRYYDPGTGKFVNRDPIGYKGGINLYGFADGNPVNESDPNGTLSPSQPTVDPLDKTIERAIIKVAPRVFRIVIRPVGLGALRIVGGSVGLFLMSQTRVADDGERQILNHQNEARKRRNRESRAGTYGKPFHYRTGVQDAVWNAAKGADGEVRDPLTGEIMNKNEEWVMGHKPGWELRKHIESARRRGIDRSKFLDEYNDPSHYRPELRRSNAGHRAEAPDNLDYWP